MAMLAVAGLSAIGNLGLAMAPGRQPASAMPPRAAPAQGAATVEGDEPPRAASGGAARQRVSFHELHVGGLANAAGISVVGGRKGRTSYHLEVSGASVKAQPRNGVTAALTGMELVGLVLDLRDAVGDGYALRIAAVGSTTYWAGPPEPVPTYALTYTSEAGPQPQPLCTTTVNEALLFAGDRYDAERKIVTATGEATGGWFNIACAGTALAKLHLTRHTEASQTVPTIAAERQAMLKMITADVCGDGTSFTVQGQALLWADAKGLTHFWGIPASREAVWTERGALCLDTPRRPEMEAAIAARCPRPPRCSEVSPATLAKGHVISANPR